MFAKLLCLVLMAAFCLKFISGAPTNNVAVTKENLVEQFAEFLHQDKEFSAAIAASGDLNTRGLIRNKRASEQFDLNVEDLSEQEEVDDQPGFFDRAAKFVIELLQRFLKWVNSD